MNDMTQTEDMARAADMVAGDNFEPVSFYICPNQFDGDDDAADKAAIDEAVDTLISTEKEAIDAATRLARSVGHRVVIQRYEPCNGNASYERHITVLTNGETYRA